MLIATPFAGADVHPNGRAVDPGVIGRQGLQDFVEVDLDVGLVEVTEADREIGRAPVPRIIVTGEKAQKGLPGNGDGAEAPPVSC
jgi:hypothetical protein